MPSLHVLHYCITKKDFKDLTTKKKGITKMEPEFLKSFKLVLINVFFFQNIFFVKHLVDFPFICYSGLVTAYCAKCV